ncbi:prolyl oligopeptidase family serine peptidase [Fibrobacterota bacterium]
MICKYIILSLVALLPQQLFSAEVLGFEERNYQAQEQGEINLPYRLFIPDGYEASVEYPLILFLHGAGQRGTDNEAHITQTNCLPLLFTGEEVQSANPCFVVAPQVQEDSQWVNFPWEDGSYVLDDLPISTSLNSALGILEELKAEFSLDSSRFYVMGLSMGGYGTWDLIMRYPDLFAAAVPVCGAGDPSRAASIADIGIWIFHGDEDPTVPVGGSREMYQALQDAGSEAVYSEIEGRNHFSWLDACAEPDLAGWLFSHARETPVSIGKGSLSIGNKPQRAETFSEFNLKGAKVDGKSGTGASWKKGRIRVEGAAPTPH